MISSCMLLMCFKVVYIRKARGLLIEVNLSEKLAKSTSKFDKVGDQISLEDVNIRSVVKCLSLLLEKRRSYMHEVL